MIVSFTGTSRGMTTEQKIALARLLAELKPEELHHGDCAGADVECAEVAAALVPRPRIIARPGLNAKDVAQEVPTGSPHNDEVREPQTHFARNRGLVDLLAEGDVLLAVTFDSQPVALGGVAYTLGYCAKRKKRFVVIWPDGHTSEVWGAEPN